MSNEVGVNPNEAHSAGDQAQVALAPLQNVHKDFRNAVEDIKAACGKKPGVSGWSAYGEEQAEHIKKIHGQGDQLGRNIKTGAGKATENDADSGTEFEFKMPGDPSPSDRFMDRNWTPGL